MSNFVEILGQNQANLNKDLKVRLVLEDPKRLNLETNLFHDINQEAQFYTEKIACNTFRVYGTIGATLNLRLRGGDKPNSDLLKFSDENWQILLLKPSAFNGERGVKRL